MQSDVSDVDFVLPKSIPSGDYLIRMENLALHIATTDGGTKTEYPSATSQPISVFS